MTVLIPTDVYHGVRSLLSGVFSRHGVRFRELNMVESDGTGDKQAVVDAIAEIAAAVNQSIGDNQKKTHQQQHQTHNVIVWMETPSNPKCEVVDIEAICHGVRTVADRWEGVLDVTTVVDGTMASPLLTRPLELGADVSFHSGTKYLAGHSDALIGTVTPSPVTPRGKQLLPLLQSVQIAGGGVASPWDSWLTLRGMRTLHVRVERQCRTAMLLAEYLVEKKKPPAQGAETRHDNAHKRDSWMPVGVAVRAVHYPGLPSHPQHDVARRQMALSGATAAAGTTTTEAEPSDVSCYGGVLSFELGNEIEATAFAGALRIAQRATSLGGTETLVEHRASIEPPDAVVSPPGLLRVSVGLEDPNDLVRDFDEAFAIVEKVLVEARTRRQ